MALDSNINATATLSIQVTGGQTITYAWTIPSEVLDRMIVVVPATAKDFKVALQPADGDKVLFVGIKADNYTAGVTYDLFGDALPLDAPHIIAGSALINKLHNQPTAVSINNPSDKPVTVDVFVLRAH